MASALQSFALDGAEYTELLRKLIGVSVRDCCVSTEDREHL